MPGINLTSCGVKTTHKRGYSFEHKQGLDSWLLMCFHTPFYYKTFDSAGSESFDGNGNVGDFLLHPPGERVAHGPLGFMEEGFANDWVFFNGPYALELIDEMKLPVNRAFTASNPSIITAHIRECMTERDRHLPGSEQKIRLILSNLLIELGREVMFNLNVGKESYKILSRVREQVLKNFGDDWTLEKMARLSGYSQSRFSSLYREYYNISPMADLIDARIANARNLLAYGGLDVGRIAELCGFSSQQYFSRIYRKVTGNPPSREGKPGSD